MSVTDGVEATAAGQDGQAYVLHIYPRLSQGTVSCCTLQVTAGTTAATVTQNVAATLGLDMTQSYALLEVRQSGGEERVLEAGDLPVERVLLWPPEAQDQHPQSQGYFFILQMESGPITEGKGNDDLCSLSPLTQDSILDNLRQRFYEQKIYTYASNILIAINPFKFLPIYNPKYVMMYEKQPLGKLSPHIFAVADVAYHTMLKKQANQCIVISGESGSGKTQSTNFLVHCLTALSQKGYSSGVERTILGAGPVLEAFGNAKTAQNNNSSRFGKFIQVNYLESGVVRGAVVEKYLLEKCRLVFRDKSERNYHVFYYLVVGASEEERKEFHLLQPEDYLYLKQENFHLEDEEDLRNEFRRLQQAMEMVGFLPPTKKQIFSVLSAILYLGNVMYTLSEDGHVLEVGPADVLSTLADLLKVKTELLVEALTKRKATTANDTLVLHYTLKEATIARDSMAKSLYSALFDWIVLHINHSLLNKRDMEASVSCLSIGILDIFGFEDFQRNSFEQFCINYANEKLQCYFNQHIFKLEQEEYQKEGITWYNIDYTDNMGCINLISKKPTGLFHLLDEESNLPQATDDTLLDKFKQQHQDNQFFVPTTVMEPAFVIQHFAGRVKYQIQDFREKNTDHMRPDIVALLRSSDRAFMRQLIGSDPVAMFRWGILRATIRIIAAFNDKGRSRHRVDSKSGTRRRSSRLSLGELRKRHSSAVHRTSCHSLIDFSFEHFDDHPLEMFEDIFANYEKRKKSKGNRQKQLIPKNLMDSRSLKHIVGLTLHDRTTRSLLHPHQKKKPPCISAQFEASLNKLLETVGRAEPFFIRCIRANAEKREMLFDEDLVLQQLRYTGMLETVRIMKSGYSAKYTFKEFLEKFRVLLPKEATTVPEDISTLLQKMGLEQTTYQIGKTKVFLKEKQRQWLVDTLNKEMMRHIVILQRWFRACLSRKHFLYKKDAATIIQRCWRGFRNETRSRAATVIQAAWRGSHERANYMRKRASIKKMQALVRSRSGWQRSQSQEERRGTETAEREKPKPAQHQRSLESRGLRRQQGLEHSPNRSQGSGSGSEVNGQDDKERNKEEEKREARGTPPLNRPLSVPLDTKSSMDRDESSTSHSHTGTVQRHTNTDEIREKAERWKERRNGGSQPDSSPEIHRLRDKRIQGLQNRGKSISMDNVSKISSSGSDSSPSTAEVRVRYRKRTKRKRRLAYPRSGLMFNLGASRESEFWSYPLPPISPAGPRVTSLSSVDVRQRKTLVQFQPLSDLVVDGSRFSLPPRRTSEGSGNPYSTTSQSTTPERYGFLSKFLKKRQQKDFQIPEDAISPSPSQSPYSYRTSSQKPADVRRNPTIKISRATRVSDQTSLDREITDTDELRHLDEFLGNQVNELRTRIKELSGTESVFLKATMQFRESIKSMYSVSKPHIGYKGLMKGYHNKVVSLSGPKQKNEVQLVVNLFQSVLDGFIRGEIKREEAEPNKTIKKTKKRKKSKCPNSPLGHMFSTYQVNIMQSCDLCGSYIWGMEKAYMCGACKLVCHKKCLTKIITDCSTRCARKDDSVPGSLHFGVQVCVLTSKAYPVPLVVEMMLEHLEMNGLYTEGIYRKSGSATRARELHQLLETDPDSAYLENYHIHTIAGMIKRWLRELPDPLMTFTLYNDFLHAVELPDRSEQLRAVYQKLDELPSANFNTLERLIFHLVMVAKEETHNLMSANSLAIVFAPCILRSPDSSDPFLGMKDVSKTTTIVEILITEQFRRYHEKMLEITELEYAEALAVKELKLRRQNTIIEKPFSELEVPHMERPTDSYPDERMLIERIKSLKQEKDDLACRLPELEQENSDNDNLDSESSVSSDSLLEGSLDSEGRINTGPKVQKPECPPKSADLAREVKGERSGQPDGQKARTPSERKRRTAVTQSLYILPGQDGSTAPLSPSSLTNNRPCTPRMNRSFSDLDIPFIDEDI